MTVRFIREPECQKITGLSKATRWRLEREDRFPRKRKISENTVGWLSTDIDEWMKNRIDATPNTKEENQKLCERLNKK